MSASHRLSNTVTPCIIIVGYVLTDVNDMVVVVSCPGGVMIRALDL